MAVYRRGKIWWFVFEFQGRRVQESSGFTNKTAALRAEARRKTFWEALMLPVSDRSVSGKEMLLSPAVALPVADPSR